MRLVLGRPVRPSSKAAKPWWRERCIIRRTCRGLRFSTRTACQNVLCPLATRKITSSTFIARSRAHCG